MGYAGWIHVQGEIEGRGLSEQHVDTVGGTSAHVTRGEDGLVVRIVMPSERKEVVYREADGVVRVAGMPAELVERLVTQGRKEDLTVERFLSKWPDAKVTRTREGEMDRYEVSAPAEDEGACAEGRCKRPAIEGVVWADVATGLVRRLDLLVDGKRMRAEYTYGEPAIRDVYDLGVPREARVVENRPDAATSEVLERLRRRFEAGFGDFVAVATETPLGEEGQEIGEGGYVYLYARSGEAFLANRYGVEFPRGKGCAGETCASRPERPDGWPTPELAVVLELLKGQQAMGVLVGDGTRVWFGEPAGAHGGVKEMVGRMTQAIPSLVARETLPGRVWPTREMLGAVGPDARTEVVRDRGRPGLVGVRVDQMVLDCGAAMNDRRRMRRSVMTFWLDPLRDDVPVESAWQSYTKGSDELEIDRRVTYTAWDRTADGRWYPAAWRAVTRLGGEGKWRVQRQDWRLRVWAGERLGAEWFAGPGGG